MKDPISMEEIICKAAEAAGIISRHLDSVKCEVITDGTDELYTDVTIKISGEIYAGTEEKAK